jgi:hypothetical protein
LLTVARLDYYDRSSHPGITQTLFGRWWVKALVTSARRAELCAVLIICLSVTTLPAESRAKQYSASVPIIEKDFGAMTKLTSADNGDVPALFYEVLQKTLKKRKKSIESMCPAADPVARRVLEDYGAIFIAKKVTPPPVCVFTSDEQVVQFQEKAGYATEMFGFDEVELQPEAMKQLLKAREEAQKENLDITPRDGAEAARRSYEDSLHLWDTRFQPALNYWLEHGRLNEEQVARLKSLPLRNQIAEVLELERDGIYFSKDLSKSILYSIAAPGTSQHIAMLAFDVNEFDNPRVREILAKHGWFQTVLSDLPHFTFLGLKEKDLPKYGLKPVEVEGQVFWIPNVVSDTAPSAASQSQ